MHSRTTESTRERILKVTAELFATQGYRATTTRQIADAVGVQQPSLFHHFPTKAAIVSTLLAWDLEKQLPVVKRIASGSERASVRLYYYLNYDIHHLMSAPYNLAGIFTEDVMSDPAFETWRHMRDQLHSDVERIVEDGITDGEFLPFDPRVVAEMISGVLVSVLTYYSGGRRSGHNVHELSAVILRGLLVSPEKFGEIHRASELDESWEVRPPGNA